MTRTRAAILGALVVIAIVLGVWWQRGGKKASVAAPAGDEVAARDDGAAGPRRSLGGDRRAVGAGADEDVAVTGKVVDSTGAGVGGMDVVFGGKTDEIVTTGGDGAFAITLRAGSYDVRASGEGRYAAKRTVEIGVEPLVIEVSELAVARGWVIDAAGKPIAGATVTANVGRARQAALDKDGVLAPVVTDANGVFEVDLVPGFDRLTADHPTGGHGRIDLRDVPPGEREEDVRIQLAPYATLRGVVRAPDGAAVAGAAITATIRDTALLRAITARSGDDGAFVLSGLVPGDVTLDAVIDGFAPADPQQVKVEAGGAVPDVTLALNLPQAVSGHVVDATGEPVYDAKVKLQRRGSDLPFRAARTDVDGGFDVAGLAPGAYAVTVLVGGVARLERQVDALPASLDLSLPP